MKQRFKLHKIMTIPAVPTPLHGCKIWALTQANKIYAISRSETINRNFWIHINQSNS
jgi:hypothetical protein